MTGIEAGKTWSRVGPEVAPTSSSASGVWTLQECSENQGAGTWPNPAFSFAGYSGHTSGGTAGNVNLGGLAGIFGGGSTTETTGGSTGNQDGPERGPVAVVRAIPEAATCNTERKVE